MKADPTLRAQPEIEGNLSIFFGCNPLRSLDSEK